MVGPASGVSALARIDDPQSRLIAAGVLFRQGRADPGVIALAIDTASAQGWRRALLAWLQVQAQVETGAVLLTFENAGEAGAVFHVYDRLALAEPPRRYTVEAGKQLQGRWSPPGGSYDLWVLGPNGYHRAFAGDLTQQSALGVVLEHAGIAELIALGAHVDQHRERGHQDGDQ